jgi:hypothetical protein
MFPINAPTTKTGKNKPPGAFVPKLISVNKIFPANKIISRRNAVCMIKISSTKTFPQPKTCGNSIPSGIANNNGIANRLTPKKL